MNKYHVDIFYSEDDEGYIANIPDLEYCSAFGETPQKALDEALIAQGLWLESAKANGIKIPDAKYKKEGKRIVKDETCEEEWGSEQDEFEYKESLIPFLEAIKQFKDEKKYLIVNDKRMAQFQKAEAEIIKLFDEFGYDYTKEIKEHNPLSPETIRLRMIADCFDVTSKNIENFRKALFEILEFTTDFNISATYDNKFSITFSFNVFDVFEDDDDS